MYDLYGTTFSYLSYHIIYIFDNSGTHISVGLGHNVSVADRCAGYGGEDHEGDNTDGGYLTGGGYGRGNSIAKVDMDDIRLAAVGTWRIMRLHVHAADEARHAGDGDAGRMMTEDDEVAIKAVDGEDSVGGDNDNAGDADEDVRVGQKGEEGVDACGDVEEGEDEIFGHDATTPWAAVPEVEADGAGLGMDGEEVVDAA